MLYSLMWSNIVYLRRSTTRTTFDCKVWSADRKKKKLVSAASVQELIQKGDLVYLTIPIGVGVFHKNYSESKIHFFHRNFNAQEVTTQSALTIN